MKTRSKWYPIGTYTLKQIRNYETKQTIITFIRNHYKIRSRIFAGATIAAILTGITIDIHALDIHNLLENKVVYATSTPPVPVQLEVKIDWTKERVIQEIQTVFPDAPIMVKVAKCESGFVPHAYNPTNGSHDGGIFQISEKYHGDRLKQLGLDPYNVRDNLKYARILYDEAGLAHWKWSKPCWSK